MKNIVLLSKLKPKNRKYIIKTALALVAVVVVVSAIPFPYTFAKSTTIPFTTVDKNIASLELGDSKVLQEGREGRKTVKVKSLQSIWGRLLGWQPTQQKDVSSTITEKPVDKTIANGTRKYQYMLCTDGHYRYFTDEQFKDNQTGFTSKSEDSCKENNQGVKLKLADSLDGSVSSPLNSPQTDTYAADKIDREAEKLRWCGEQDEKNGNEYIGKVQQAQAVQDITDKEFNAIVDPAYFKYSNQVKSLRAAGCTITVVYPDYTRQ